MTVLGSKWSTVRGIWNPLDPDSKILWKPHDRDLEIEIEAVFNNMIEKVTVSADYNAISCCKQREGEPYEDYLARMREVFRQRNVSRCQVL